MSQPMGAEPKSLYADLTDSKTLLLLSGRQLRRYKNCVPQESEINGQVLQRMRAAATEAKVPDHGWAGGLHHDEMKLQQDLILSMDKNPAGPCTEPRRLDRRW
jgi:hypothetical protein